MKKQVVSCTIPSKFPTQQAIEAGIDLYLRSGCNAIVTIGSGTVTDAGKGIRHGLHLRQLEPQRKSILAKRVMYAAGSGLDIIYSGKYTTIPLLSLARSVSSVHGLSVWTSLHNDEDAFLSRACPVPEVLFRTNFFIHKFYFTI